MRTKVSTLSLFLSLLVLSSSKDECNNDKELTHVRINIGDEYIGEGGPIVPYGDGFAGIEYAQSIPPFYQISPLHQGHYKLHSFGYRGQGPDDFLFAANIQYLNDERLGIYDRDSKSYKEVSLSKNKEDVLTINKVNFEQVYFRAIKTYDNQYIGLSSDNGLFHLMDSTGNKKAEFFEYPFMDRAERGIKNSTRAMTYQGSLVANPQKTKMIYAPLNGEIIHFYNTEKDKITLIHKIEKNYPIYQKVDAETFSTSRIDFDKSTVGYVSITASDNYVYALYCGKKMRDIIIDNRIMRTAYILRKFDWKGNMVHSWTLDVPCSHIGISSDCKKIWALAHTPEITPVYFDINE